MERSDGHVSELALEKRSHNLLYKAMRCETRYGTIGSWSDIDHNGKRLRVHHANPAALLHRAAELSAEFGTFVAACIQANGGEGHVVWYSDECKPGNALRPEPARTFNGIYWTLAEFPDWYRNKCDTAWMPCAYVLSAELKHAADLT